jgi:hypothetical protein
MKEDEYREFLENLYRQEIEKKLARIRRKQHPIDLLDQQHVHIPELTRAMRALRFIEDYFDQEEELRRSLTKGMVDQTLATVEDGARYNNRLVGDTEIADVIQEHFAEIVDGMTVDDFPKEDFEILRESGSSDPRQDLAGVIYSLRARKDRMRKELQYLASLADRGYEEGFSESLKRTPEIIAQQRKVLADEGAPQTKEKMGKAKIWTGMSKICQGTLLSITNITIAVGFWHIAVPAEAATVGAVTSVTGGIGLILEGVGKLRGE